MSEEMKATVSEDPELFDVAPEEETANETEGKLSVWETIVKGLCKFASGLVSAANIIVPTKGAKSCSST